MPAKPSQYADPNKLEKPDAATQLVLDSYKRVRDSFVEHKQPQWEEGYDAWRSAVEIQDDDLRTKLVIPLIFANVESVISRLASIRPAVEVWGRGSEDESRADAHRALLEYDWDLLEMQLKISDFVKSAVIYGAAWMKVVHRRKEEVRVVRERGEDGELVFRPKKVETWNDPWVDICDIDQIFPDMDGKDVDSCEYIIQRLGKYSLHELESAVKDGKPLYQNLGELKKLAADSNQASSQTHRKSLRDRVREEFDDSSTTMPDPHKRQFTLLEYWTDSKVISVIEEFPQLPPIRNEFNELGKKPFVLFTPIPDPNNLYGLSLPEVLYALQLELSTIHSARVDNLMYNVHQMWMILESSGISPRQIKFRPGGHVWVKDMGDIQPLPRQGTDFSLYRETDEIRRWAQNAGITDTFAGIRSNLTGNTATEATLLAEASGSKVAFMFARLSEQALTRLGRLLIRINTMYTDHNRMIRIAGDDFVEAEFREVTPDELISGSGVDLDVRIDIAQAEPESRAMKLQRAERGLGVLAQLGMPLNHPVMKVYLADFMRGTGIRNPRQFVDSDEANAIGAAAEAGGGAGSDPAASLAQALAQQLGGNAGG